MNYRERDFQNKFTSAAHHLKVRPNQVISLKLRDIVGSYQEYQDLVDILEREAGLHSVKIDADLQGRGYLIGDSKSKIIIVEHETGLELLYIAGSVSSLITLIPLVLQGWHAIRGRFGGRHARMSNGVEIRQLDSSGKLQEEHLPSIGAYLSMGMLAPSLATTASLIENEMKNLTQQVMTLTLRVEAIEKQIPKSAKSKSGKADPKKPVSKKSKDKSK